MTRRNGTEGPIRPWTERSCHVHQAHILSRKCFRRRNNGHSSKTDPYIRRATIPTSEWHSLCYYSNDSIRAKQSAVNDLSDNSESCPAPMLGLQISAHSIQGESSYETSYGSSICCGDCRRHRWFVAGWRSFLAQRSSTPGPRLSRSSRNCGADVGVPCCRAGNERNRASGRCHPQLFLRAGITTGRRGTTNRVHATSHAPRSQSHLATIAPRFTTLVLDSPDLSTCPNPTCCLVRRAHLLVAEKDGRECPSFHFGHGRVLSAEAFHCNNDTPSEPAEGAWKWGPLLIRVCGVGLCQTMFELRVVEGRQLLGHVWPSLSTVSTAPFHPLVNSYRNFCSVRFGNQSWHDSDWATQKRLHSLRFRDLRQVTGRESVVDNGQRLRLTFQLCQLHQLNELLWGPVSKQLANQRSALGIKGFAVSRLWKATQGHQARWRINTPVPCRFFECSCTNLLFAFRLGQHADAFVRPWWQSFSVEMIGQDNVREFVRQSVLLPRIGVNANVDPTTHDSALLNLHCRTTHRTADATSQRSLILAQRCMNNHVAARRPPSWSRLLKPGGRDRRPQRLADCRKIDQVQRPISSANAKIVGLLNQPSSGLVSSAMNDLAVRSRTFCWFRQGTFQRRENNQHAHPDSHQIPPASKVRIDSLSTAIPKTVPPPSPCGEIDSRSRRNHGLGNGIGRSWHSEILLSLSVYREINARPSGSGAGCLCTTFPRKYGRTNRCIS